MKMNYKKTKYACFIGYIVQAIVNNFIPLLFLTFQSTYGIPIVKITFLATFNFGIQLLIDFISPRFVDKWGYRMSMILANIFSAAGLVGLAVLPNICKDAFSGLLVSVVIYAIGGGLLEVIISPIVEACPNDNKEAAMSLLHSFYCWGHVGVVLISTIFFMTFGTKNWGILSIIWSAIPITNVFFFLRVPIPSVLDDVKNSLSVKELLGNKLFWIMALFMACAGASDQSIIQWASVLAEEGLGVNKSIGDLMGPMMFAGLMGISRATYGKVGNKISMEKVLIGNGIVCILCYLIMGICKIPIISLLSCGICGFSVGVFWPGTISMSAAKIKRGGTAMFAYLALAGDLGCSLGPTVVGRVSGIAGGELKKGILVSTIFPLILCIGVILSQMRRGSVAK